MDFRCAMCTEHRDDTIHNPNLVNSHDYVESAHEQLFRNTTLNEDGMIQVKRGGMKWGERLNSNIRPDGLDQRILDEDSMILETVAALINRARHRRGLPELDEQDGDEMFQLDCYLTDAAAGHIPTLADQEDYDHTEHIHMSLPDDIHWGITEKHEPTTFKIPAHHEVWINGVKIQEATPGLIGPYFDVASLHPEEVWINANQFPFGPFTQEEPVENHGDWEFERDNAKRNHPSNGDRMTQFDKTIFNAVADKAAKTEGIISNGYIDGDSVQASLDVDNNHFFTTGEVRSTSSTGGMKGRKPQRFEFIPPKALNILAEMYGKGAIKYEETSDNPNWRKGYPWSDSYSAMMRHITAFWGGEDMDPETKLPHMASVAFHALSLITFMDEHPEFDDRYKKSDEEALQWTGSNGWQIDNWLDQWFGAKLVGVVTGRTHLVVKRKFQQDLRLPVSVGDYIVHDESGFSVRSSKQSIQEEIKRARCYRFEDRKDTIPCGTCLPCLRDAENVERQRLNASAAASSRTVEIEYAGTNRQTVLKWLIDNWDAATPENVETMFTAMKLDVGSRIKIIEGGRIAWITSKEKFKEQ